MENVREPVTSLETFTHGGMPKLDNADATFKKVNMQVNFDGAQGSPAGFPGQAQDAYLPCPPWPPSRRTSSLDSLCSDPRGRDPIR